MTNRFVLVFAALLLIAGCATQSAPGCYPHRDDTGRIARNRAAVIEFRKSNPCPTTNRRTGTCSDYEVDHVKPLCACGPDTPNNMQWLTIEQHREKTRQDVARCRAQ